jgi:ACS family glucarate transporter-like MFS transporter
MVLDYFEYIFFYWIYYYLSEIRHVEPKETALYTTALFVTWAVMTPLGGWASDRMVTRFGGLGLRIIAIGGLGLSAILLFAGARAENVLLAVSLMSLALGLAACADVTFWTATISIAGCQSGTACGIMNTGGNLGGLVAPVLRAGTQPKRAGLLVCIGCLMALTGEDLILYRSDSKTEFNFSVGPVQNPASARFRQVN